jgi:hypothetical protein
MSKASRRTGRSLREGLRRTLPTHSQQSSAVPSTTDPKDKLAAAQAAAKHPRRGLRK